MEQNQPTGQRPEASQKHTPILSITLAIFTFLLTSLTGYLIYQNQALRQQLNNLQQPQAQACTLEAKICPDGSSVGRTLPNCEFAPCPQVTTTPTITNSPQSPALEEEIGYIKRIYEQNKKKYLDIDYVQWLEHGKCRYENETRNSQLPICNPNGFLILNENPKIRTFEISDSTNFDFSDFQNAGLSFTEETLNDSLPFISISQFSKLFDPQNKSDDWLKESLYHVKVENNTVTGIRYQFQP